MAESCRLSKTHQKRARRRLFSFNTCRIIDQTALLRLPAMYQWPCASA
jgi:hypothetical protein